MKDIALPAPRVPEGRRIYVIGDIHGRADLLDQLHELIVADAAANPELNHLAVYLGDYVDRGFESRQVIDGLLANPLKGFETVYLKGNHEHVLLEFLKDSDIGFNWFSIGGQSTVYSYGATHRPMNSNRDFDSIQPLFRSSLPSDHEEFFRALKPYHIEGDYLFVHAGIRPGVALADQEDVDLLSIRGEFLESNADHGKIVVHGHSIVDQPESHSNRIAIDTGAFATGRLTCLVLQETEQNFLTT